MKGFQRDHDLPDSGVADERTLRAMDRAAPLSGGGSSLMNRVCAIFANLFGRR